jgi:hypothetical protein
VLATTVTDSAGHYEFTDQTGIPGTGQFTVAIVVPAGDVQTTPNAGAIAISRGSVDKNWVSFGIDASAATPGVVIGQAQPGVGENSVRVPTAAIPPRVVISPPPAANVQVTVATPQTTMPVGQRLYVHVIDAARQATSIPGVATGLPPADLEDGDVQADALGGNQFQFDHLRGHHWTVSGASWLNASDR